MHIVDGIAYAGEKSPAIKVKSVRPLADYRLWVRFTTGEEKIFDFTPLLDFPCYRPLKEKTVFDSVYVDFGTAAWRDGEIDIAPENLYANGLPAATITSA